MTAWMLFTIFVFGPCEPLVPLLMIPAAEHSGWGLVWVTMVFATVTLVTMAGLVALGYFGVSRISHPGHQRYTHALAGLSLTLCGVAIMFGL